MVPYNHRPSQLPESGIPHGLLQVQSIGGARYFITFIDDSSNCSVVYPMRKKSEAFHYYKLFVYYAQTHTGRKIKVLRSDRGGEYLSDKFQTHLDESGTQHQMTSACTPEQNGVAERLNRTLMNLVRSMLAHKTINNSKHLSLKVGKVAIPRLQMRRCVRAHTLLVLTMRHHRLRLMIPQSQVSIPLIKFIHGSNPDLNRVGLVEFGIQCQSGGEQCMLQVSRHMHTLLRTFQTPTNRQ